MTPAHLAASIGLGVALLLILAAFIAIAICLYKLRRQETQMARELSDQQGTILAAYNTAYDAIVASNANRERIQALEPPTRRDTMRRPVTRDTVVQAEIVRGREHAVPGTLPIASVDMCTIGAAKRRAKKLDNIAQSSSRMDDSAREFDSLATAINDHYRGPEVKSKDPPSPVLASISAFLSKAKNKIISREQST